MAPRVKKAGNTMILTGMGSLSYGEQAGERMRLGHMLNDPEEEQDCFSDHTHVDHIRPSPTHYFYRIHRHMPPQNRAAAAVAMHYVMD